MSEMLSYPFEKVPVAFEKIAVSTTAIGFTTTNIYPASGVQIPRSAALISVETNSIRVRTDGSDPTATDGHLLAAGDYMMIMGTTAMSQLKMIRASADATVQVTFYR